jgi:uncharacterized membrane protein YphA (DoxX/SURF4 family)
MPSLFTKLQQTIPLRSVFLIRLAVGAVFFFEGVQKFMFSDELAVGRFSRIGLPWPEFTGPFVGGVEVVCGALILIGWFTRPAAFALLINISVAIVSTKIPILLGHDFAGFTVSKLPRYGFLSMMHEARTDFAMWLGLLFLLIVGAGGWSLDAQAGGAKPAR